MSFYSTPYDEKRNPLICCGIVHLLRGRPEHDFIEVNVVGLANCKREYPSVGLGEMPT